MIEPVILISMKSLQFYNYTIMGRICSVSRMYTAQQQLLSKTDDLVFAYVTQ